MFWFEGIRKRLTGGREKLSFGTLQLDLKANIASKHSCRHRLERLNWSDLAPFERKQSIGENVEAEDSAEA